MKAGGTGMWDGQGKLVMKYTVLNPTAKYMECVSDRKTVQIYVEQHWWNNGLS